MSAVAVIEIGAGCLAAGVLIGIVVATLVIARTAMALVRAAIAGV